jgi:hypothetical protein
MSKIPWKPVFRTTYPPLLQTDPSQLNARSMIMSFWAFSSSKSAASDCRFPPLTLDLLLLFALRQIQPIQSVCRWVLTYNLIAGPNSADHSAQALTTKLEDFTDLLAQCDQSPTLKQILIYPLEHQYTHRGLRMTLLKDQDAHRVSHVLQGCQAQGNFYMLLGNTELIVVHPNGEAEDQEYWARKLLLDAIVSLSGLELLQGCSISIGQGTLLDIYD